MIQKPWAKSKALNNPTELPTPPPTMPNPSDPPTEQTAIQDITQIIQKATPLSKPTNKRKTQLHTWSFKKLKTETTRQIRRNSNNNQNIPTYTAQAQLLQQDQPLTPENVAILMQIAADEATKTSRASVKTKLNELERRLDNLTNGQITKIIE